jgi:hypothetical protein
MPEIAATRSVRKHVAEGLATKLRDINAWQSRKLADADEEQGAIIQELMTATGMAIAQCPRGTCAARGSDQSLSAQPS